MKDITRLMYHQLHDMQNQIQMACTPPDPACPTDQRYAHEWVALRDYADVVVSNIDILIEDGSDEALLHAKIKLVLQTLIPATNALLEGYILDLSSCQHEDGYPCKLRDRAQQWLDLRNDLRTGPYSA